MQLGSVFIPRTFRLVLQTKSGQKETSIPSPSAKAFGEPPYGQVLCISWCSAASLDPGCMSPSNSPSASMMTIFQIPHGRMLLPTASSLQRGAILQVSQKASFSLAGQADRTLILVMEPRYCTIPISELFPSSGSPRRAMRGVLRRKINGIWD